MSRLNPLAGLGLILFHSLAAARFKFHVRRDSGADTSDADSDSRGPRDDILKSRVRIVACGECLARYPHPRRQSGGLAADVGAAERRRAAAAGARATECIVRKASADPRYRANMRPDDFNDLIVDSIAACERPVRAMIDAHDRMYGNGIGRGLSARPLSRRAARGGGQAGAHQDAGALSEVRAASAGRSTSVIGSVNSTTAATTISADGTPTASPSTP